MENANYLKTMNSRLRYCSSCLHIDKRRKHSLKTPIKWLLEKKELWCCYGEPFKVRPHAHKYMGLDERCPNKVKD